MRRRSWKFVGWAAAAVVVIGVLSVAYLFPSVTWPRPSGKYAVGTRLFEVDAERRRMLVRVWYPAADTHDTTRRPYFNSLEERTTLRGVADILELPAPTFHGFKHLSTFEYTDAPVATAGAPFPVIVFSHGYWLYPTQNTALMEHLASHGYIVFSLSHAGDSAPVAHPDGTVSETVPYEEVPGATHEGEIRFWGGRSHDERTEAIHVYRQEVDRGRLGASFRTWRADTQLLLRRLEDTQHSPAGLADLMPAMDLTHLGLAGMSFGGSIAASVCREEPRCGAAVNIDGDEFDFDLYDADYPRPLLLLCSDWNEYPYTSHQVRDPSYHFNDYAYERWSTAGTAPNLYRIVVRGIQHVGFTDLILSMNRPVRDRIFGSIDGREAVSVTNDFVLDFFDRYFKQQRLDFPRAELAEHPRASRRTASEVREWWHGRNPDPVP